MNFVNGFHEQKYEALIERMGAGNDVYRKALAYLITADEECSKHIEQIYDFDDRCIKLECLNSSWNTSTSRKTLNLAFNLYTGCTDWADSASDCAVADIFCCCLAPFYWEAIKLRYPEYSAE